MSKFGERPTHRGHSLLRNPVADATGIGSIGLRPGFCGVREHHTSIEQAFMLFLRQEVNAQITLLHKVIYKLQVAL